MVLKEYSLIQKDQAEEVRAALCRLLLNEVPRLTGDARQSLRVSLSISS
jgi:hypothetical protein